MSKHTQVATGRDVETGKQIYLHVDAAKNPQTGDYAVAGQIRDNDGQLFYSDQIDMVYTVWDKKTGKGK